ncbi:tyrosine--tRNA ligase [Pedobacter sp. SYSU D00535]|uniref:tyrosine--tRNA ligase n=1 Tax=Pedobacter sp. SYSU D00535 TaxID=2810308 RepID=UPI001A96E26C|nr:tyrosine--tRNA ligase [Pedobacter sp. SYSU D00535]
MNFIEELRWRGMIQDIMPGTEDELTKEIVSGYIGFDPTAESLHVGHLTQIMTLTHFQRAGHKPFALVGGATGMIGDPSFKSQERNLLDEETLQKNVAGIKGQLEKFLDFDCGENSAEMVNNYDWFKDFTFLDFIRDIGKLITVNYMMAKDSVKKRLDGTSGLSFTEFSYQLLQGYDFYWLWKNKDIKIQMGGSDQWGNIVTGTEIIRRKAQGTAFGLTTQLIKKADGTKFGKTESGAVWLDSKRTSPYNFYQFWLNTADSDAKNWIKVFSVKSRAEIETLEAEHDAAPHLRVLQKALAAEITERVHSKHALETAIKTSEFLFGNGTIDFMNELEADEIISIFEGLPQFEVKAAISQSGMEVVPLLTEHSSVFSSRSELRKLISAGGLSINKEKVESPEMVIKSEKLIKDRFLVVQKGKKTYFLLVFNR